MSKDNEATSVKLTNEEVLADTLLAAAAQFSELRSATSSSMDIPTEDLREASVLIYEAGSLLIKQILDDSTVGPYVKHALSNDLERGIASFVWTRFGLVSPWAGDLRIVIDTAKEVREWHSTYGEDLDHLSSLSSLQLLFIYISKAAEDYILCPDERRQLSKLGPKFGFLPPISEAECMLCWGLHALMLDPPEDTISEGGEIE